MIDKILKFCKKNECQLLYATFYGSHLYGLNNRNSDIDIKGVILPSYKKCLLYEKVQSISQSTGDDKNKNKKSDVDIQLWSLQYWLDLVFKGDTNALDLLYSWSNKKQVIYYHNTFIDYFMKNPLYLYNPLKIKAFIGYAINQAKRYGIRGSRFGIIKDIRKHIKPIKDENPDDKLYKYIDSIIEYFGDDNFCIKKKIKNGEQEIDSLIICNKIYLGNITLQDTFDRLDFAYKQYGERSKQALKAHGLDYKALSHAVRAILQMKQLLIFKEIKFPFKGKEKQLLLQIKNGKLSYEDIEKIIIDGIMNIEKLQENVQMKEQYNKKYINKMILNLYKIKIE
jgi:hypothetical protein